MEQEPTDEAVLAIKPGTDEDTVTYLRTKLLERDRTLKVKGGMCE